MKLIVKVVLIASFFILFFLSKMAFDNVDNSETWALSDSCDAYIEQIASTQIAHNRQVDSLRKLIPIKPIEVK